MKISSYVIDTSATAPWILPDEESLIVEKIFERVFAGQINLVAPTLWSIECINFIRNAMRRNRINEKEAGQSLAALEGLPVDLVSFSPVEYFTLFNLSVQYELTAYDAAYFYLAQKTGANLITLDSDLLKLKNRFSFILKPEEV